MIRLRQRAMILPMRAPRYALPVAQLAAATRRQFAVSRIVPYAYAAAMHMPCRLRHARDACLLMLPSALDGVVTYDGEF